MTATTEQIQEAEQQLHEIIRKDVPFDQKAREALELGTRCLEADHGYLNQIDNATEHWETVITTEKADEQISSEITREFRETCCGKTIDDDSPLTIQNLNQGRGADPTPEASDFDGYLSVPLILDDEPYGTVCFVANGSRSDPFGDAETLFAEHLARLLERELARDQVEAQLTKQTNLATVLNRVLRHNLRNDASVIRGYTEVMAEHLGDNETVETILKHIDDLIQLSDKARELEQIISASSERRQTEVSSFVEEIVERIAREHPSATISIECDYDIDVGVLPNLDRAFEELIENAVKHSGDHPTVTIDIEAVPNAVEIRIQDDGPGLPEQEARVLTEGAESPLTHGSGLGLWLAHWIINSHDGSIEPVVTENGTTMVLSLPRTPSVTTQQRMTELSRSRDKYKAAFDNATDAIALLNDDGRIMDANSRAGDVFGVSAEDELLGRHITDFLPDEFDFEPEWQKVLQPGTELDTVTVRGADGVERVLEYSAAADVVPEQHLFVSREVTERIEQEQELVQTQQMLERSQQMSSSASFEFNLETGTLERWSGLSDLPYLTPKHLETVETALEHVHPDDRDRVRTRIQEAAETASDYDIVYRVVYTEETVRWYRSVAEVIDTDGKRVLQGMVQDITERKEREEELAEKTRQLEAIVQNTSEAIYIKDTEGFYQFINESAAELLGNSPEEIIGKHDADLFDTEREADIEAVDTQVIESGEEVSEETVRFIDGEKHVFLDNKYPYRDEDGEIIGLIGISPEITERKERERQVATLKDRYETLLEAAPDPVFVADTDTGEIIEVNEAAETTIGVSSDEIVGLHFSELHPADQSEQYRQLFEEHMETDETRRQLPDGSQIYVETDDGEQIPVEISVNTVALPERSVVYGIFRDISEQLERERELRVKTRAMEKAPIGITLADPDQDDNPIVYANERFCELTGYDEDEILGRNCRFMQGEKTDAERVARIRESIDAQEKTTIDLRNYRKDGTEFWNRLQLAPVRNDEGEVINWIGFQQDVTDRKERERRLYKTIADHTEDGVFVFDSTQNLIEANESAREYLSQTDEFARLTATELRGVTSKTVFGSLLATVEERERLETALDIVSDGEGPVSLELKLETGELVRCECSRLEGKTAQTVVAWHTLEESQQLELETGEDTPDDMERARDLYRRTLENITDSVVITDDTGEFTWVCPNVHFIFGYSATEITQNGGIESIFDGGVPVTSEDLEPDGIVENSEATVTTRSGETRDVLVTAKRVSIGDGTILYVLSDITERKERERAIEEMSQRLEAIIEASPNPIVAFDTDGRIEVWNDAAASVFGYSQAEAIGQRFQNLDVFPAETASKFQARLERALDGEVFENLEVEYRSKDGTRVDISVSAAPIRDNTGEISGIMSVAKDITARNESND